MRILFFTAAICFLLVPLAAKATSLNGPECEVTAKILETKDIRKDNLVFKKLYIKIYQTNCTFLTIGKEIEATIGPDIGDFMRKDVTIKSGIEKVSGLAPEGIDTFLNWDPVTIQNELSFQTDLPD